MLSTLTLAFTVTSASVGGQGIPGGPSLDDQWDACVHFGSYIGQAYTSCADADWTIYDQFVSDIIRGREDCEAAVQDMLVALVDCARDPSDWAGLNDFDERSEVYFGLKHAITDAAVEALNEANYEAGACNDALNNLMSETAQLQIAVAQKQAAIDGLEASLLQAQNALAMAEGKKATLEAEKMTLLQDKTQLTREKALLQEAKTQLTTQRNEAINDKDQAVQAKNQAVKAKNQAVKAKNAALTQLNDAQQSLAECNSEKDSLNAKLDAYSKKDVTELAAPVKKAPADDESWTSTVSKKQLVEEEPF